MAKCQYCIVFIVVMILVELSVTGASFAFNNVITVYYDKEIGQLNEKVFGTSFLSFDMALRGKGNKHSYGYADYGAGVWNPKANKSVPEVIGLAKEAGISSLRFTTNNYYNWKSAIGKNRNHYLYGIDEFMKVSNEISAEPIFTIPYITADVQDAADLVEYLNVPGDHLYPWAAKRVINGRTQPYKVKYFEIGNEIFGKVTPEQYAKKYLDYYKAMKAVDPSIHIGVSLDLRNRHNWNTMVMDIINERVDFGILHTYPTLFPRIADTRIEKVSPLHVFSVSLAVPGIKDESEYREILKLLKEKSGRVVPLAITEHNGGFVLNKPVPYRHALGTALINAELLRIFMKPDNNILMANYHHFSNGHFGMVKSKDNFIKHEYKNPIKYIKRPNFYVYELYNKHFGRVLIDADVRSDHYNIEGDEIYLQEIIKNIKEGIVLGENLLPDKWKIKSLPGVYTEENSGTLKIDFVDPSKFNYHHAYKEIKIQPNMYYRLSGYIKTENLDDRVGVNLLISGRRSLLKLKDRSLAYTEKIKGTNDWQYVHVLYEAPSDVESAAVMVRRIGNEGPLRGKAFLKEVKLEAFEPDTKIPYLSVNASKSENGNEIYLMVINKNLKEPLTALINIVNYVKEQEVVDKKLNINTWTLNGPSVDATNEINANTVKVKQRSFEVESSSFEMTFEPHSLTAVEIQYI